MDQKTQRSRASPPTLCHGVARIFLTAPRSYDAGALHRGQCEQLLRYGKLATSSMIDFDHHGQPGLAYRGVWCPAFVLHALEVVGLKARNPGVNRGAGDLQKWTDTALTPALCIEGNDLHAGLGTLGIAVVVEQGELLRGGGGQPLPQPLHGMVMDAVGQRMKNDARQFAGTEALVEAFEALEFVDNLGGDATTTASRDDLARRGDQPEHALRLKAAFEGPHR